MEEIATRVEIEDIAFKPVREIMGMSFIVRDYQRGYKWGKKEVCELLNDLNEHETSLGKYCLQPVIFRQAFVDGETKVELIDGQQRITTIYLILAFLRNNQQDIFNISYDTRLESREFLSTKITDLTHYVKAKVPWESFIEIDEFKRFDNVDVYHFYTVYQEIYLWFEPRNDDDFRRQFEDKLLEIVHIIWYNVDQPHKRPILKITAEDLFLNLNAGKIQLTSSELIKALFILECQNNYQKEIANLKATQLALEWDQIENKLHDNPFWFFICDNDHYSASPTRIDFLFDIINSRNTYRDDDLFSYRIYEERFKKDKDLDWAEVKTTFNKLMEWFDSKQIFHYAGFLIVSRIIGLKQLLEQSKTLSKTLFLNELLNRIKKEFRKTRNDETGGEYLVYDPDRLNYEDFRKECERALLLLNILYYINNQSENKFPFELYKMESWSVEHINPQKPREIETVWLIRRWLEANLSYYSSHKKNDDPIVRQIVVVLENFKNITRDDTRKFSDLKLDKEQVVEFDTLAESISEDLGLHGISNLALLDRYTNSKLGNKPYLEKRELILQLDQDGKYRLQDGTDKQVFIPTCTKNVFSKIYTCDDGSITDAFFGKTDMEDYQSFIDRQLSDFTSNGLHQ